MNKPTVFISYSHKDETWKDRLRPHLGVLEKEDRITIWDDRQIEPTDEWYDEIKRIMAKAAVAVCLISSDYLNSEFCIKEEIPYLLERRKRDGMVLFLVLLRPCAWKTVSWLKPLQMLPRDGQSVARDFKEDWDTVFAEVAERIFEILDDPDYHPPAPPAPEWPPPEKVDIHRLPVTGAELFGRQEEMELLDDAWKFDGTNVVSLVAWGGVGKSTLVNKWLERMAAENYRGARCVYAGSFFSQGSGERATSADVFIAEALEWFGDADPRASSPWDKGQRLADLVRAQKTLLLLDGLEPLQSALKTERGNVKDPALATLIAELARDNPGLCVITTREAVADLARFRETIREENLEQISAEAGRALLRVGGVRGTDAELESATSDFGKHALALNLLGAYLHEVSGQPISHAAEIPDLDIPEDEGRHPRRVMAAFQERFGDGPEVELLRMLGLFDRPANGEEIASLKAAPPIPDLTEHLHGLAEGDWLHPLDKLRGCGLIAPKSRHQPDTLDAHPLVREHFGQQLREMYPDAWREGNDRLYEHLKQVPKEEFPDTIEEMAPLFAAVAHGCAAGRHQEALDEVFRRRIQRGDEFFSTHKLGAVGADLAALAGFFEPPWRRPVASLTESDRAFVLYHAGNGLRSLGRLKEATEPMRSALEAAIAGGDLANAAVGAGGLSTLHLTIGELAQALDYAQKSVKLADQSDNSFQRMARRITMAHALHQAGRMPEAEALFREAEAMQKERQPEFPQLYSVQGFWYCDLLLDQEKHQEVQDRAGQTFKWAKQASGVRLLDIALNHLSLGQAHMFEAQREGTSDFSKAAEHLEHAVDDLRQSGQQEFIVGGLLSRAALHRVTGAHQEARRDLGEAASIAERGAMGRYQADAHLEFARLYLAMCDKPKARESLNEAKKMIESMGYHRRDGEVAELEGPLSEKS